MQKEEIIECLTKFGYDYTVNGNSINVKLGLSQIAIINFLENDTIKITDKLIGWNFLTGLITMSLKTAIIYNSIIIILTTYIVFISFLKVDNATPYLFLFTMLALFMIFFLIYYSIKLESFRIQLSSFIKNR